MIAFLPAPVSTPFHAAAWSRCWLCAVCRERRPPRAGPSPSLPAVAASIPAWYVPTARFSSAAASATTARSPVSFCAGRRARMPPEPVHAPRPRDRCRRRSRRARRRRAARRHRAGRPGGSSASTPARRSRCWTSDVGVAPLVEALAHRRQGVVVRVVEVAGERAQLGLVDRASGPCLRLRRLTSLLPRSRDGRPWSGRTRRGSRRCPAAAGSAGGVGRERDEARPRRTRRAPCTALRIAACCASTPMMLAVTERAFLFVYTPTLAT